MELNRQENSPELWLNTFPRPAIDGHKYHRGHAAVFGAPDLTGATRLAAMACNRIGAGLVTVVADENADIYKVALPPDIMVRSSLPEKVAAALGGSGGIRKRTLYELAENSDLYGRVFDADALLSKPDFQRMDGSCVLTPHVGEFERMFGPVKDNLDIAAAHAAELSGAIIVLKSPKTFIAHPDGRLAVNSHTSPYLAKAGTGDVLAGIITGLLTQGMPHFQACCAGVWIHGEAGIRLGIGLVASDIQMIIPQILHDLFQDVLPEIT